MGDLRCEVFGLNKLEKRLFKISKELRASQEKTLNEDTHHIGEVIEQRAPVGETGELRISVEVRRKREMYWQIIAGNAKTYAPDDNYNYARAAEFGTTKMVAKPFFFPTYRSLRSWHLRRMQEAKNEVIKRNEI